VIPLGSPGRNSTRSGHLYSARCWRENATSSSAEAAWPSRNATWDVEPSLQPQHRLRAFRFPLEYNFGEVQR
jgi:hypothetical protein